MYQKIKYITIATIILIVVIMLITLDANRRYSEINKNQSQETTNNNSTIYPQNYQSNETNDSTEDPSVLAQINKNKEQSNVLLPYSKPEQNNLQNTNTPIQRNETNVPQEYNFNQFNQLEQQTKNKTELEILPNELGELKSENGSSQQNYSLEKQFKINEDTYAIVSSWESTTNSNEYINKKFYIYKKINNDYIFANYLFETVVKTTDNKNTQNIDIQKNKEQLNIKYQGTPSISRNIDIRLLNNNYLQYDSYPKLKYIEKEQTNINETNSTEETKKENTINLQP